MARLGLFEDRLDALHVLVLVLLVPELLAVYDVSHLVKALPRAGSGVRKVLIRDVLQIRLAHVYELIVPLQLSRLLLGGSSNNYTSLSHSNRYLVVRLNLFDLSLFNWLLGSLLNEVRHDYH